MRRWGSDEVPAFEQFGNMDHHHNKIVRLQLIPPTVRGNQVKKNVAFIHFQQIIDTGSRNNNCFMSCVRLYTCDLLWRVLEAISLMAKADIGDVTDILAKDLYRLKALYDENYVMMNIVRLIDIITGERSRFFFCK